ncbi:hypothetical protein [Vogesella sp. LIG4]|uniref:hypothetical protein n=1 Tax=Vogesella sp. LIG4 TaxID=1192162 RepID=UPI00081FCB7A|nr:hypothetical protein [Vogesella sp. LIG4]SCK05226.1 polar amino acid transport system substrate-binding protein [Vogesella sp. LIG4]
MTQPPYRQLCQLIWLGSALLLAMPAAAQAGTVLKVCVDEVPWLPYTVPDDRRPGTMQQLLQLTATELDVQVVSSYKPWKRCLQEVSSGQQDALLGAGPAPLNLGLSVFPLRYGKVDPERALGAARVVAFRRIASNVDWDGHHFQHLTRPVAVPSSYPLLIDAARRGGAQVDDGGKSSEQNLGKLLAERVDLAIGYENDLKDATDKHFRGLVTQLPLAISEDFYYLSFSRRFYTAHIALAEQLWAALPRLRKSDQYLQLISH